jgi:hypothetical protein
MAVPLSEDEQRILSEIEEHLYESDPDLVREVGSYTVYSHAFRNLKWAVLLFIVGLAFLVFSLSIHVFLAFAGFVVMLSAAIWAERNARRLGRAGWEQMTRNMRSSGVREFFGSQSQKMRDRFRRDEN